MKGEQQSMPHEDSLRSSGDAAYEQFLQLFARHESALRGFVHTLIPGRDHGDEILQETCLVLWRKFAEFDVNTSFLRWACTIARFEVLRYRRRLARDRHVFQEPLLMQLADEALDELEQRDAEHRALQQCLERLPRGQRELVRACYAPGVTIRSAAEQLGRSATALYKALNRIRASLLACIAASLAREAGT